MQALSGEQLLEWLVATGDGWRRLIAEHPEVLGVPATMRETHDVAGVLQHIVAVELRYAERLDGLPATEYGAIGLSAEALFGTHAQAMTMLRGLLARSDYDWDAEMEFATRSSGQMRASRRAVLVHLAMHSIRHYAQLATLVREYGVKPGWEMDYLFLCARPV